MANEKYGGYWYNENENSIVLCTLTNTTSAGNPLYYPNLYKVDLATNIKKHIFPSDAEDLSSLLIPSEVEIVRYEHPVITFNKDTKVYNVSFLSFGNTGGVWLHSTDIVEVDKYSCRLEGTPIIHILGQNTT